MHGRILHGFKEETPEAKALWFASLSLSERMEIFCEFMDLILAVNPGIGAHKNVEQIQKGIRIISRE